MINGEEITDEYLYNVIERTRIAEEKSGIQVTFFEGTTAAAFLAFAENPADFLILETGMGGRLDATNIVENKIATVITSISYDHLDFLGDSLTKIAGEKAGIMRANIPCIIAAQAEEALVALDKYAEEHQVPTLIHGYDFGISLKEDGIYYLSEKQQFKFGRLGLIGDHQYLNAAAAVTAIFSLNLGITSEQINQALAKTKWPARLQKIEHGPLRKLIPDNWQIYIDGAHNPGGGQVLGIWANDLDIEAPLYVICGMTRNRDVQAFLQFLAPKIKKLVGVYIEDEALSYKGEIVAREARKLGVNSQAAETLEEAIELITQENNGKPACLLCCGSLFLAGMFLRKNGDLNR